jgi:hypothetical protein
MNDGIYLSEVSDDVFQINRNYDKKKNVKFYMHVDNSRLVESKVVDFLVKDGKMNIHTEMINGKYTELRELIYKFIIENENNNIDSEPNSRGTHSNTKNKSKKQNDIIELFLEFIEMNKNRFNKQILKTMDVYNEFNTFLTANNSNIDCKYNKLLSLLKQHCNIKAKSHEFSDGVAQGIYFPALIKSPSEDASDISSETPWVNPIESWLTTNYTVTKIQNDRIKCDELYNTYLKYSNSFITQKQFGQYMVILEHKSKSLHGVRYYVGILKNTDESTS